MKISEIVRNIMFDYDELSKGQLEDLCASLPKKVIRWMGSYHPDNRTRKIFFEMTGIKIGKDAVINQHFIVSDNYESLLVIGDRVAISPNVTIICSSDPNNSLLKEMSYVKETLICKKPVIVQSDVWIGTNVTILPGVTIGESSIIGAGSIVIKDVPSHTVVAGVPADIIRYLKRK